MVCNDLNPDNEEIDIKNILRCYFNGEYLRKAKRFKKKMEESIPEELYYSITGLNLSKPKVSKTNNISDPTGETVLRIIEVEEERKMYYKYYNRLQEKISLLLNQLNVTDEDKIILYAYLGLSGESMKKAIKYTGYNYSHGRTKIIKLIKHLEGELKAVIRLYDSV
ncbi:MAG: hypothetical protein ACOCRK_01580 [bacterium]